MTYTGSLKKKITALLTASLTAVALGTGLLFTSAAEPPEGTTQETTASITFSGGSLLLVSASSIDFGSGSVTTVDTDYGAQNGVDIVIADNRGTEEGWQLTAELSEFLIGERQALEDATITVSQVGITKQNTSNSSGTPRVADTVTMVAGVGYASPIATAASGQGAGGWTVSFRQQDIRLAVQADTAREGLATAQIDWVITSGA